MKVHELKIKEEYYKEVALGRKTFELRKDDRDYEVGDLIKFNKGLFNPYKYDGKSDMVEEYYPRPEDTLFQITYILRNVPEYGLDKDYCILGLKRVEIVGVERI